MSTTCKKKYFNNYLNAFTRVAYLPLVGTVAGGFTFTAYNPFVFLGRAASNGGVVPNGAVGSVVYDWISAASNVLGLNQLYALYQSILSANISEDGFNQSGFLEWEPLPNQKPDYTDYLRKYLSDELIPQNLSSFIHPYNIAMNFWSAEQQFEALVATYDYLTAERIYSVLVKSMQEITDYRLYLPAGIVTMAGDATNTDPYWNGVKAEGDSADGEKGYFILELKSFD